MPMRSVTMRIRLYSRLGDFTDSTMNTFALLLLPLLLFPLCFAASTPSPSPAPSPDSSPFPPTTTTSPTTTTADPTLCSLNASLACVAAFDRFYQRRGVNGSYTPANDSTLSASLHCDMPQAANTCMAIISTACSALASTTLYANYTAYGLRCVDTNTTVGLQWIAWNPDVCPAAVQLSIGRSTAAFCGSTINSTLVCKPANTTLSVLTVDRSVLLSAVYKADGCTTPVPATTTIGLLPNPVGPEAITAIVVLVTIAVIAIMAAFFFWPKCHISADSQQLVPKAKKPKMAPGVVAPMTVGVGEDGEMNAGYGIDGGAVGGAVGGR